MRANLSVVIPAYNEEANLARCLTSVSAVLKRLKLESEIIVVNDGSSDKTGEIAKSFLKKIPGLKIVTNNPNRGYGGSLKAGFLAARKDFIVMTHADNQLDFSEVDKFLDLQSQTGADIVSGVRAGGGDAFYRTFLRWGWNTLVRALFGYLASDIDCGFKLFRRQILDRVNLPSDGAMIDTQLLAGSRARNLKVVEIPIRHYPRTAGVATGENPQVIMKAIKELAVFWWQLKQEILVEQGKAIFRWELIAILAILAVAAFVRLYRIDQYMTFLGDEGRDAIAMRDIVLLKHIPLIGPGTSIGNMYLGPWYYYLTAPSLLLAGFSPVGPSIQVAIIGLLTIALIWWIGRQWFGRTPALLISTLYSLSPTIIISSRSSWNPNVTPFFALLTIYGIWKVWRLGYWRWLVIAAVSFAFVLNSHYLGLLLFPVFGLFWLLSPKTPKARYYSLYAVILFLFLMSPLLWFDLRHNWSNFKSIKTFFTDRQATVNFKAYKALPNIWPIWQDISVSLLSAKNKPVGITIAAMLVLGWLWLATHRPSKDFWFLSAWLITGLIGLGLYKQHIYDHYYGFLFPAPFLLLGFIIDKFKKLKLLTIPFILILLIIMVTNSPIRYPPNNQMAHIREISGFIAQESANKPFNLALIAKRNYDAGYRYFLQLNQSPYFTIHQKLADQLFVVCEEPVCEPIGNPLWEIAAFGWAKIGEQWEFPWGVKVFKLIHNPSGKP